MSNRNKPFINNPRKRDTYQPLLNGQIDTAVGQTQQQNGGYRIPSLASCGRGLGTAVSNGTVRQQRAMHRPWNARPAENYDVPEIVLQSKRQRIRSECANNSSAVPANVQQRKNGYHPSRGRGGQQSQPQSRSWRRRKSPGNRQQSGGTLSLNQRRNLNEPDLAPSTMVRSAELSDLPGYSYDPKTRKYYKILPNGPAQPAGSTPKQLNKLRVEHICKAIPLSSIAGIKSESSKAKSGGNSLPHLLRNLQLASGRSTFPFVRERRVLEEHKVRGVRQTPSYAFEVTDTLSDNFAGCQFLDISDDGRSLVGCWALGVQCLYADEFYSSSSRIISYNLSVDSSLAQDESAKYHCGENLLNSNGQYSCNTYGLRFGSVDNVVHVESTLVDMCLAPADEDVTCVLYATANSFFHPTRNNQERIVTRCTVHMRPVEFNLTEEGRESMNSPVYNTEWFTEDPIWSLSFNSKDMKICIGMERCATIFNILSEKSYKVSSGGKNVISSGFTKDGTTLFLGRRNAKTSLLDLRLTSNHLAGELDSPSTCFLRQMDHRPNLVLTENFEGKIKIWDLRTMGCVTEFHGHRNSSHKLPCFVDPTERFIFAVGEDAVVRGWSLATNDQLCAVKTFPRSNAVNSSTDFPRVVYSDRLGGLGGNSAIVIAVNGDLLVHELTAAV